MGNIPAMLWFVSCFNSSHYTAKLDATVFMPCDFQRDANITWYRGNHSIKLGGHYSVISNRSLSVLQVSNISCNVAGNYTCEAANNNSIDQQQFTLNVSDLPPPPSNLTVDPITKNITWTVDPGFECLPKSRFVVRYKKSSSSVWNVSDGSLDNRSYQLTNASKGEKYDVSVYAVNCIGMSLKIPMVSFWTNIKPSKVVLWVNSKPVLHSQTVFLRGGEAVKIECFATAEPKPNFTWQLYTRRIPPFRLEKSTANYSNITWRSALIINKMSCNYTIFYRCIVQNHMGHSSGLIALRVKEIEPPRTFSVVFFNNTCARITWSADNCNGFLPTGLVVSMRPEGEGESKWVHKLYNCNDSASGRDLILTSQFDHGTSYEFEGRVMYGSNGSGVFGHIVKLFIVPDLIDITMTTHFPGRTGTTMTIVCSAIGASPFSFSWSKDHVTLQPSYRVKIEVSSNSSTLTIREMEKAGSGNYTCNVSNSAASKQETVYVRVSDPPQVDIWPLTKTSFEGESVTFQCLLSRGNMSKLSVTWYEKTGDSEEQLISSSNDSFTLTLKGFLLDGMERHVIRYRCVVRNPDGVGSSPPATFVVLRKGNAAVCDSEVSFTVSWSVTSAGVIDVQQCPHAAGRAVRPCLTAGSGGARWAQANFSNCISERFKDIHDEVEAVTEGYEITRTLHNILEDLENATALYGASQVNEPSNHLYEKDLAITVDVLQKLVKYNAENGTRPLSNEQDNTNFVKTASNLLKLSNLPTWRTAFKTQDDVAYQLISALDEYGHQSTENMKDIHTEADNVVLIAVSASANSSAGVKGLHMEHGQSSLDLPQTLFNQTNDSVTVVAVMFSTLGDVLSSTEGVNTSFNDVSDWSLNSRLASITIKPRPPDVIEPPFTVALETNKVSKSDNKKQCVSSYMTQIQSGIWSTQGCTLVSSHTNVTTTTCSCNHMTLFAVLMDVNDGKVKDTLHSHALSWISVAGCLLSLFGVTVTLSVTLYFWKSLRSPRTVVLLHLCVAIAISDVLIVTMELVDVEDKTGCTALAVLLHFFVLSIFCWMLSEGVQLYVSLVQIIGVSAGDHIWLFYCLGWGIPAVIVSISLAATQGLGYADEQTCWLSTEKHVIWAFVAPVLVIITVNMAVFVLVIRSMFSSERLRKEPLIKKFRRGLRASFVLLPLLGITWSFGVLSMISDKIVFKYIFAIFNSLQGFFIFVFHCAVNKQTRDVISEHRTKKARLSTQGISGPSTWKLSTTTESRVSSLQGTSVTPLRLLNFKLYEHCRSRIAFEETSFTSDGIKVPRPAVPGRYHADLFQEKLEELATEKQGQTEKETLSLECLDEFDTAEWQAEQDRTRSESSFESSNDKDPRVCRKIEKPLALVVADCNHSNEAL